MNTTVLEGQRAELECLPKEPGSTVEWYRDGVRLTELPELVARTDLCTNGSLVLRRADSSDPGEYECRVRDSADHVQSAAAFLDVQCECPSPPATSFPYSSHIHLSSDFRQGKSGVFT